MGKTVSIGYGIMIPPIKEQLEKQGLKFNEEKVAEFEAQRQCLLDLRFGLLDLPDSMYDKLLQRLHKVVMKHLNKENK